MIKAGSPELSDKEADAKASIMPGSRRKRGISEQKLSFSAFVSEMFSAIGEEETKPYKGFVQGKNHPEGGLSREEAKRHGIHAGIETKDEAKRKGGFGKLSDKTQSRRKSFCARMQGMKKHNTSAKTANDPKSKINASLRVWGCRSEAHQPKKEKP
jgi:hypothetical protein